MGSRCCRGTCSGHPVDVQRPDPLIEINTSKSVTLRPAELHQLTGIVANALVSDASFRAELQPVLQELGWAGSGGSPAGRRGRNRRTDRIDAAVGELEAAWLVGDGEDRAGRPGGTARSDPSART